MTSRIAILPRTLIDQIAAGEVIVRPASVIKELMENALDAGATRIAVEVSEDVRDLSVTDDGCGMTPEEAPLAVQRHATSKITSIEDLVRVQTRGFRGEALASIAAVSRLTLTTRTPDALAAVRLLIEGGDLVRTQSIGAPIGTSVQVRDLFYNTPARLKFMRAPSTELRRVLEVVSSQALSHPEAGVTLTAKGRVMLELPAGQSLEDRIRQVLGISSGPSLIPLSSGNLPVTISGFIAPPESARRDRGGQYFFVNRRPVSNRILTVTLEQAFRGLIMTGRYPVAVVFLFVEPETVDVNVHPTKEEVRFEDERRIGGILHRVVKEALTSVHLVPRADLPDVPGQAASGARPTSHETLGIFSTPENLMRQRFQQEAEAFRRQEVLPLVIPPSPPKQAPEEESGEKMPRPFTPPREEQTMEKPAPASPSELWDIVAAAHPAGQIGETYLILISGDSLLLVDQHAAHERILYEKIIARAAAPEVQKLLIPVTFEVDVPQTPLMDALIPLLRELGLEVEPFGGRSYVINGVPADLAESDPAALVRELLETPDLDPARRPALEIRDRIAARMACHGAIRAGRRLTSEEIVSLMDQLRRTRLAFTCPHGRPTMILFTRAQLDRQFKRTV